MTKFKNSIKYDLLRITFLILALSTVALSAVLAITQKKIHENSLLTKGQGLAALIGKLSQEPLLLQDVIQLNAIVQEAIKDEDVVYAVIHDAKGNCLTSPYASIDFGSAKLQAVLAGLSRDSELPDYISAFKKVDDIQEIAIPVSIGLETIGAVTVGVSSSRVWYMIAQTILSVFVLSGFVLIALGIALYYYTNKKILTPISGLAEAADRLAQGDLSTRVTEKSSGEVQLLIDSFNRMSEDLEKTTVSKDYVNEIIASMRDTLIVADLDGTISRINLAASLLLGYEQTELIGLPLSLVVEDDPGSKKPTVAAILESSSISAVEKFYRARNGKMIPMFFSASVMRGIDGQAQGIVCVAQDITERKQAEEALRESAVNLTATLNATADGILAVGANGKVLFFNHQFAEMWNIPRTILATGDDNALLGYVLAQLIDPDAFVEEVNRLYDSEASSFDTIDFKDGRVLERYSFSLLQGKGQPLGRVWSFRDITARREAEEKLQKYSTELLEINEEIKSFAYIVSHDLRAPLVNIKGFSDELIYSVKELGPLLAKCLDALPAGEREKLSEVLQKDIPESISFIGSSVSRMDNLIGAILKLSRVGRRELSPEPVAVSELIGTIVESLSHQTGAKNAQVKVAAGLPEVIADKTALGQIFGNLLDNAVKYLEPGRPGLIEVSGAHADGEWLFQVRDNGRGMARADIPRAFEIFRRVGRQDVAGEGMGLAYVKTLVRLLGGRIWCESEPGCGTTFSFTLPVAAIGSGPLND
ncbi:MAG: PAS domain S-box protein [Desulfobulbaceae bacterium]|nr:PAS domain S-box protein [Desulfobulbaceae bacterium]